MLLLAIKARVKTSIELAMLKKSFEDVNWSAIDKAVAKDFKADQKHVTELRKTFEKEQSAVAQESKNRGRGSDQYDKSLYQNVYPEHFAELWSCVF